MFIYSFAVYLKMVMIAMRMKWITRTSVREKGIFINKLFNNRLLFFIIDNTTIIIFYCLNK